LSSHNRLKLSDRRDVERKTLHTLSLLNMKNLSPVIMGEGFVNPFELYTTQTHIEADKLGLVLQKTLFESYDVPIIVVIGKNAYKYIIDGHHRALVSLWMRKHVRAVLINAAGYQPVFSTPLYKIKFVNPVDTPESLLTWRHMVNTIHFLEELHGRIARVWFENVRLDVLKPTQMLLGGSLNKEVKIEEPILVYRINHSYYVLDGHKRVCLSLLNKHKIIPSVVFTLDDLEIGIVRQAQIIRESFSEESCKKIFG